MRRILAAVVALVLVQAEPAVAQNPSPDTAPRASVDGGLFFANYETYGTYDSDKIAFTNGVAIGAGVFFSPQSSVRVEFEQPGWYDVESRRLANGVPFVSRHGRRASLTSVLYAHHGPLRGRRRLVYPMGLSFVNFADRYANVFAGDDERSTSRSSSYGFSAVTFGLDAEFMLTKHLAVVPSFRLYFWVSVRGGGAIRPAVKLRWSFGEQRRSPPATPEP